MPKSTLAALLLLLAGSSHAQSNCDTLREQIDAKIRASGVSALRLDVVDAAASAPGRNVGSCERGARKILYTQQGGAPAGPVAAMPRRYRAASAPVSTVVITECKDGSMPHDGRCR